MDLASLDLMTDVFSFLSLLHSNDIAPRRKRFLSPTTINHLNPLLIVPEEIPFAPRYRKGGKRGLTERETARIRFIHFLCEAAHLVALTGRFLKPTPRAARWLAASDFERTQILFDAAFLSSHRRLDDLWRAYRLPGFRRDAYPHVLAPLLDLLRAIPRQQTVTLATLDKMIPLAVFDDAPENQPDAIWRGLVQYLTWFGVSTWHTRASFRLTDLGMALLSHRAASRSAPPSPAPSLALTRTFDLIATPHANWLTLYQLGDYAELISIKPHRVYRPDRMRVQRALQRGDTLAHLIHFLEAAVQDALPHALTETLQVWAQELDRVTIRRLTVLETRDRATLEQLTRVRGLRACIRRTLSPRAVTLHADRLPALIRQLKRYGFPPRLELPASYDDSTNQRSNEATRQRFNDPTTAHLYLAAHIGHVLPELIPAPYRVPYSIVLELEKQMGEHDHELAAQIIDELVGDKRQTTAEKIRRSETSVVGNQRSLVETLTRAVEQGTPLAITYYAASHGETTRRVIEPLRLEWRGDVPYLIAFCRLREDERVFRVERIIEMTIQPRNTPAVAATA